MPKIPLTSLNLAPQGQGGVNPPDTGLISDAVGKAIQSAGQDRARGAMAVAEGEMAKGKAIAGIGKSLGNVAEAFAALGEREKKLDSLETRLAFDQDLQRHYLTRDEFELANSNNPIDKNGKNIFTDYAIRGIADLRKKYGEMELDPNTAGYIAGQLSEHTIKSPADARINSIRQRGVNFNNQFKTALEGNNFDNANQINQAARDNGLINDIQFEANSSAIGESKKKFVREGGDQRVSALLLDNNITEADKEFAKLQEEGGYTDDEKKYNQAVYDNKKANTVVYNTTLNNALEQPSVEYQRILDEEKLRTQPNWKDNPKDPTGLGRLDNVQIADLKEKVGSVVSTKANEQLGKVVGGLQNAPAGETREQFSERLKKEAPELYNYDNGAIAAFLFDYSKSGKAAQGGITGYFLDKINEIDFEDQSAGALQEKGMLMDAIEQFTDGGIKDELKKQWSQREKLHTDPASLPQVKTMEAMADAMVDALPIPEIPAPDVVLEPSETRHWMNPKRWFGYAETEAKIGRPGKMEKQTYQDADGNTIEKEVFVPDTDKSQEEIIKQERKDLSNAIKAQLRENAANGKYKNEDGTFNTDLFRNDFNGIMSDLNPPTVPARTRGITTPNDESESITPQERAVKESGAQVPMPTPAPMGYELPPVEQLEEVFNPEQLSPEAGAAPQIAALPAAPEGGYKYVVDTRTRDELESTSSTIGSRIVSLDYNSSEGGANYALIVIPNDATPEEREAAQLYVDSLTEWFRSNGVEVNDPVVKTTGENGRGVGGFFHTEPAFVQNAAAMALLKDKADEHAAILASTLGVIPGTKFIAPHKSNDPGAGAPGILGERDFARAYTLPSLQKVLAGEAAPMAARGVTAATPQVSQQITQEPGYNIIDYKTLPTNQQSPAQGAATNPPVGVPMAGYGAMPTPEQLYGPQAAAVPNTVATGGTVDYLNKVGAATKVNVTTSTTPVLEGPVTPLDLPMTVKEVKEDGKTLYKADSTDVYNYALERFKNSPLKGMKVADGAQYGVANGTPEEWAFFITKLVEQESGFVIDTLGDEGKYVGGSNGLGQLSPGDGGNTDNYTFGKDFTKEELKNPLFNLEATIRVVEALISQDRVIRENDRGAGRYFTNTLRNKVGRWKESISGLQ